MRTFIINFSFKILDFYISYRKTILIISLISSILFTTGCVLFLIIYPEYIIQQTGVCLEYITKGLKVTAENMVKELMDILVPLKEVCRLYQLNPAAIRELYCPSTILKDWLLAHAPNHLLTDKIGRFFYVLTREIQVNFQQFHPINDVPAFIAQVDPHDYEAIATSFEQAHTIINAHNRILDCAFEVIKEENKKIATGQFWLTTGIVVGISAITYITYKLICG